MSTTIERPRGRRVLRAGGLVALVLGGWTLIMLAMPLVGPARQLAVVGDPAAAVRTIAAAGGQVVEIRDGATLARSDRGGFGWRLYRAGAPLVLEGRIAAGCFSPKR